MSTMKAYLIILLTGVIGLVSLVLFIYLDSLSIIDLELTRTGALLLDTGLSLIFFFQHSILVRRGVRARLGGIIPDACYGAFYSITSGIALLIVVVFWQHTPEKIILVEGAASWPVHAIRILAVAGFVWGTRSLVSFDPLGIKSIIRHLNRTRDRSMPLSVRGAYRWVRHPLYFFVLILIWACPAFTMDRLLFNVLWSIWIVIGAFLEERDLLAEFGDKYRGYQSEVPMLIPYKAPFAGPLTK